MNLHTFRKFHEEGLISGASFEKVKAAESRRLFSLHWELKVLLYLGVLLLSGGLGILVYENIDTIGHQAVLAVIALISAAGYWYCNKKKSPFSWQKVPTPDPLFDYLLLLACLTMVTFIAYLQYQYGVFGDHLKLAGFVPMVILFFCAYYFDHLGVLTLAITNLAAWMGIVVTPTQVLRQNDFSNSTLIYTGMLLGGMLVTAGEISAWKKWKAHFRFTYVNIGLHVLFIACLAGMFHFEHRYFAWFLLLLGIAFYCYRQALRHHSFYFIVIMALYTYIGLGYVVVRLLEKIYTNDLGPIYLGLIYLIASAIAMILGLIRFNRKMKKA
ncbi:DUF2157 domain-containing protein [Chitinophaga japonensis]|uniref:Putative membrane protein DUF2157 n=1 Tax=Chitinophaga japonensis TaxID=104662 RepID=A0A562SZ62_CHIJA|nr:DUF2157 domain-containing protein [Chitinophaga japonensis]TWI86587.1 putative membrane protein DUF2157 [Chitinophaga japonensis]